MARNTTGPIQQYRGTTAQHSAYTGPSGELTVDTTKNVVVVHNGTTAGGFPMVPESRTVTGSGSIKINGGASGNLSGDIAVALDTDSLVPSLISATAGNIITNDNGKLYAVAVDVADDDPLLSKDGDGDVQSTINLGYNITSGVLTLTGRDGLTVASVTIPAATSMLESVTLEVNPVGEPSGTYLHFVFNLSDGSTENLYVDVTTLIDIYTSGNGAIGIAGYVITFQAKTGGGIGIAADGAYVVSSELLSTNSGNTLIVGTDNKLMVPAVTCDSLLSVTAGNAAVCDNGIYVPCDYGTM